jgi:N-acetylglutamate synthase-like GNAT family acetyltransferase
LDEPAQGKATTHVLADGMTVLVRQLVPQDGALYPDFIANVTAEDLRMRLFTPVGEVTPEMIEHFTHYDSATAMAFIALGEDGAMLGVARLHEDPDRRGGEFAVLVRSALKGHGLGWLLMQHVIDDARDKGLATVHGEVLAENLTMLQMCKELGFGIADEPNERGVKRVTLRLVMA